MRRIEKLRLLWDQLNAEHFGGLLHPVPIRITRSRRTYGYFHGPNHRAGNASIRISHVLADTPELVRDTMLHEMVHQQLYEWNVPEWHGHGPAFQREHVRVFGHQYVEPD